MSTQQLSAYWRRQNRLDRLAVGLIWAVAVGLFVGLVVVITLARMP